MIYATDNDLEAIDSQLDDFDDRVEVLYRYLVKGHAMDKIGAGYLGIDSSQPGRLVSSLTRAYGFSGKNGGRYRSCSREIIEDFVDNYWPSPRNGAVSEGTFDRFLRQYRSQQEAAAAQQRQRQQQAAAAQQRQRQQQAEWERQQREAEARAQAERERQRREAEARAQAEWERQQRENRRQELRRQIRAAANDRNDYDGALKLIRQYQTEGFPLEDLWWDVGYCYAGQERWSSAIDAYDHYLTHYQEYDLYHGNPYREMAPNFRKVWRNKYLCYKKLDQLDKALEALETARRYAVFGENDALPQLDQELQALRETIALSAQREKGIRLFRDKDYDGAWEILSDLREQHPGEMKNAWFHYAYLCVERGMEDEGLTAYRMALNYNEKDDASRNNLANILKRRGDLDGAEEQYRRALELLEEKKDSLDSGYYQDSREMYQKNLDLLLSQKRKKQEEEAARAAIENARKEGIRLFQDKDYDGAWEILSDLREQHPDEMKNAWFYYAYLCVEKDMEDEGLAAYRMALNYDEKDDSSRNNLAIILKQRGDLDGAEEQYRRALELLEEKKDSLDSEYYQRSREMYQKNLDLLLSQKRKKQEEEERRRREEEEAERRRQQEAEEAERRRQQEAEEAERRRQQEAEEAERRRQQEAEEAARRERQKKEDEEMLMLLM